ncbi:hypothetical protein X777_10509 [Ooceraea biroi]|uniref:Uncharacterized protein n=1 Tax=Ooceraea biroi TaxID=2015173 RepID=A0A026X092_OOCBI|nr:hypothetical protein X777_10509 [Ooceraea biroi]
MCNSTQLSAHPNSFSLSHLPPIKLPPFDSSYEDWEQFRDRFTTLIVNNKDIDDFACIHFFNSCLKGRALECIANISITAENFNVARKTLTSHYESKRRLLNLHFSSLLNLTAIPRESATEPAPLKR